MKTFLALISIIFLSNSAMAVEYNCIGNFDRKIDFSIKIRKNTTILTVGDETCNPQLDAAYKPTAQYKNFKRFNLGAQATRNPAWLKCKKLTEEMLGSGNSFDSIKVSPDLLNGVEVGNLTFIYDEGDYHGQLVHEKVECAI